MPQARGCALTSSVHGKETPQTHRENQTGPKHGWGKGRSEVRQGEQRAEADSQWCAATVFSFLDISSIQAGLQVRSSQDNLELLILLPLSQKCWGGRSASHQWFMEHWGPRMLHKHSTLYKHSLFCAGITGMCGRIQFSFYLLLSICVWRRSEIGSSCLDNTFPLKDLSRPLNCIFLN